MLKLVNRFPKLLKLNFIRYYDKKITDLVENPKNAGSLNSEDKNVGTGYVGSPACGDVLKIQIKVGEDGKISSAKFKVI